MLRTLALSGCIASAHGLTLGGAAPAHVVSHVPCTRSPAPLLAAVDDKAEVTEYFNNEGFSRWNRIYSEDGEVRRARAPREATTPTEPFHACAHTLIAALIPRAHFWQRASLSSLARGAKLVQKNQQRSSSIKSSESNRLESSDSEKRTSRLKKPRRNEPPQNATLWVSLSRGGVPC
jgi:hypothetical protein|tara:strand:+ start:541 stop:1071 length:531 start_codon:yes stop_codon:yes gene_type:complete